VRTAQVLLLVRVDDVNDNAPSIRVNTAPSLSGGSAPLAGGPSTPVGGGSGQVQPEVLEGSDVGTFVAHVSVEDLDGQENGLFHCSLLEGDAYFELRQLYTSEFKVITLVKFDREQRDRYDLTISCVDNGSPALTSTLSVRVNVVDRNDHPPTFTIGLYSLSIDENNAVGVSIGRVKATDQDVGPNGNVTYRMGENRDSGSEDLVDIDPLTGIISAKIRLDREKSHGFSFDVVASDQSAEPRSSTSRVEVIVHDLDDEAPVFTMPNYSFAIKENQLEGVEVGVVSAIDRDESPFSNVTYAIVQSEVS